MGKKTAVGIVSDGGHGSAVHPHTGQRRQCALGRFGNASRRIGLDHGGVVFDCRGGGERLFHIHRRHAQNRGQRRDGIRGIFDLGGLNIDAFRIRIDGVGVVLGIEDFTAGGPQCAQLDLCR